MSMVLDIRKCDKMRQLFITKYDSFYKIRRLLNQKVNLAQSDSKNRISLNLLKPNKKTDFKWQLVFYLKDVYCSGQFHLCIHKTVDIPWRKVLFKIYFDVLMKNFKMYILNESEDFLSSCILNYQTGLE